MIIKPQPNSSIIEEIKDLELGNYTIFAGKNNTGKSSLARAIENHENLKDYKKIFIPAEHTQPQNEETKTSAAKFEFYKLIKSILDPIFNKNVLKDLIKEFNNSKDKEIFVSDVNKILKSFGVEKKEFDVKILNDEFEKDFIIKSLVKAFVKDLYETEIQEVNLENIGMGTQRLIVAALIKYYVENKIKKSDEKILIIFEEPELYLHPEWKKGLHNALLEFCKGENSKVLITTHDPYFIDIAKDQKIYKVFRNEDHDDTTNIEEIKKESFLLSYNSSSEINYFVFDLPTKTYFLELYENILDLFKAKKRYNR